MLRKPGILSMILRGAKKGKGKGEETKMEATTDVINIYKDQADPELKPRSEYPEWLFPMVYEYVEHPSEIARRMYRGEKQTLTYRQQRRLYKWSKRTIIVTNNQLRPSRYREDPRRKDLIEMDLPGGEETDHDPDDNMISLLKISLGAPPKYIIEENLAKYRRETGAETKEGK